jgi:putative surface cell wall-binding protein
MSLTTVGPTASPAIRGRPLTGLVVLAVALVGLSSLLPATAGAATQEDKTQFAVTAGSLTFSSLPALPTLASVVLNGQAQTTNTAMTNIGVADATGSGSGWNVTVEGQAGTGKSAVFAAYCPKAKCGAESEGYIGAGPTLAANSLTLNSTGASFTALNGTTGTGPTLQCSTACNVDHASAVKILSAAKEAGLGTYITTGFTGTSLALATPTTLKVLPNEEVYRVNLLWTLSTGP